MAGSPQLHSEGKLAENGVTGVKDQDRTSHTKEVGCGFLIGSDELNDPEEALPHQDAQTGVQGIEAITLAWSKESLIAILCLIWLVTLIDGFKTTIVYSLTAFATSDFQSHSLLTVIDTVSNAMTAAVYIPMAKVLDVWGRAEGVLLMLSFCIIGLILLGASQNLATYCAGQVFYSVGFGGLGYSWDVLTADVTNLRNRGLAFAFTSSPGLITAFAGSAAAEAFLNNVNWRWGIACWAIAFPAVVLPLYGVLKYNLSKAKKHGILKSNKDERTLGQRVWYVIREFDLPGVVLFAGGFVVFLLPFTLASSAPQGWKTPYIVAMIVTGFVTIVLFFLYQHYLAPAPFLRYEFLTDRTILGACLLDMTYQISYYCYASYLTSFLMVVNNVSVAEAGYIGNIFSAVSFVVLFIVGWYIRKTGYFKWLLFGCVPLYIFSLGLMIYFRRPNQNVGYIVMCEVLFSIPGGIFILCVQLAVLAVVDHQHVAAVLAFLFVSGTLGDAIGSTISGVIWTNTFLKALERNLPDTSADDILAIYESVDTQLAYLVGSPERLGIQKSYGFAQTRMIAAGTAIMVLCFVWVAMMRNVNVKKMSQTRGTVF